MRPLFNRSIFFNKIRPIFPNGKLTLQQVGGISVKLDLWEDSCRELDLRWFANILAQNKWETGSAMVPVKEKGGKSYLTKLYDVNGSNPTRARANGNKNPGDGERYCGRGDIQITWYNNYLYFEKLLGIPLTQDPSQALIPINSARIMFIGMIGGHFTGKKLGDYFTSTSDDPYNARSIVNGDKTKIPKGSTKTVGRLIEAEHRAFFTALTQAVR